MSEVVKQGVVAADSARVELYDTLSQLRVKLDYAQRIDDSVARTRHRIAAEKRDNPLIFAAGVAAVAATCGVAVWAIGRQLLRVFE